MLLDTKKTGEHSDSTTAPLSETTASVSRPEFVRLPKTGGDPYFGLGRPEQTLERFMQYAVSLGADKASWIPSQFTRMPDGLRSSSTRQTVYFFNPSVLK